jgi:hypothetical protein
VSIGKEPMAGLSCKPAACPGTTSAAAAAPALNHHAFKLAGGRRRQQRRLHFLQHATSAAKAAAATSSSAPVAEVPGVKYVSNKKPKACFEVCTTTTSAAATKTLAAVVYAAKVGVPDYGDACKKGSDCASGICGTSCSTRDWRVARSTSCMCPTNEPERAGCCACLSYDPSAPQGSPIVMQACPAGHASAEEPHNDTACATPARGSLEAVFMRLDLIGAMDDELTEEGAPKKHIIEVTFDPKNEAGLAKGLPVGAPCREHTDCSFGICGIGCDCDSEVEKECSCNSVSNFPFKTCGGCNRGRGGLGATAGPCPVGVEITTFKAADGGSTWLPREGEQVSVNYCILIALEAKVWGAPQGLLHGLLQGFLDPSKAVNRTPLNVRLDKPPSSCVDTPVKKKVWEAIRVASDADADALFETLAVAACETPLDPEEQGDEAGEESGCRCDYGPLVEALGKDKVDPAVCRPPPPEPPSAAKAEGPAAAEEEEPAEAEEPAKAKP